MSDTTRKSTHDNQGQVILVVDDDSLNRRIHSCYVRKLGFRSEEQDSGERAVEAFQKLRRQGIVIAGIIMDIKMPGIDGLEAAHQIRKIEALHPFCYCSCQDGVVPSQNEVTSPATTDNGALDAPEGDAVVPEKSRNLLSHPCLCNHYCTRTPMWAVSTTTLEEQAHSPAMKLVSATDKGPPWRKAGFDAFLLKPAHQLQLSKLLKSAKRKAASRAINNVSVTDLQKKDVRHLECRSPTSQNSAQTRNSQSEWPQMDSNQVVSH